MIRPRSIRNVAIVAHIDHGKTTLIDSVFRSAQVFEAHQQVEERVMDSNELEHERGITIRSKQCSVEWRDHLINIVDTPGHADFSGEVERVLSMVDSVLLLVDANEGPMPQTRYVLGRALALGYRPVVLLNKADRPGADAEAALEKTFDLFVDLGADDDQGDFPHLYGSALEGWVVRDLENDPREGMEALFETLVDYVPAPRIEEGRFRMQVSTLAWSDYVGQIGCGRVLSGELRKGDPLVRVLTRETEEGSFEVVRTETTRASHLWVTRGLERQEVDRVGAGEIVWLTASAEIGIGDTFADPEFEDPALPPLEIEEPTVSMLFMVNDGPFSGRDGDSVTIRRLRDRLEREVRANVALRVRDAGRADAVEVSGRGELHLAILIEEMRREGMEFCVSRPEVITHEDAAGNRLEPMEQAIIEVPEEHQGAVISKLSNRKGELLGVTVAGGDTVRLEFRIPTRGLIGYRGEFLTDTRGMGVLASRFLEYGPWVGPIPARSRGAMVAMYHGDVTTHSLENLQQRGALFVRPGDPVYTGQIVGESARGGDLPCNPTKKKQVTNHRSATKEIDVGLKTPRDMSLDQALEWIAEDELVEVTPGTIRLRKAILDFEDRKRAAKQAAGG